MTVVDVMSTRRAALRGLAVQRGGGTAVGVAGAHAAGTHGRVRGAV